MKGKSKVEISVCSDVGGRRENQDNFLIDTEITGNQEKEIYNRAAEEIDRQRIFIVCDGMGGEQYGKDASRMAVEYFEDFLAGCKGSFTTMDIAGAIRRLNREIAEYYRCRGARGGTTISVVVLHPDKIMEVFNIGDSPVFLVRNKEISMISEQQSLAGMKLKKGILTREEYDKSKEKNILLGYLGDRSDTSVDNLFYSRREYKEGDKILLSSDGLLDAAPPEQILVYLNEGYGARELIAEAKKKQVRDNITAILLEIA